MPGIKPRPRVEPWPRGGAKSSTGELGIAYLGCRLARRFVLYVSETQDQADRHVGSVASLFEKRGIDRALSKYGHSRGWRRDQLRTANGFNVAALGLDVGSRGIKLDEFRPDMVIFDDIDSQNDGPLKLEKKINTITSAIIPAGSIDCAYLFLQNLIHEESIVSQLCDGRADFLHSRETPIVVPAVKGLKGDWVPQPDGSKKYRISEGEATWSGQSLAVCESQIEDWGLATFKREAQHEVHGADGFFFNHLQFRIEKELPDVALRFCLAGDLAATEGGGDWTCLVLMAIAPNGVMYVVNVWREQWGTDKVEKLLVEVCHEVQTTYGKYDLRLPQDPGQAGKWQKNHLKTLLKDFEPEIIAVTGKKATRAKPWQNKVNAGNAVLIEGDWNRVYINEHRLFKEDETHEHDDQVDPSGDAATKLVPVKKRSIQTQSGSWI